MAGGAERTSPLGLQFRFRSKLLRSQLRKRGSVQGRASHSTTTRAGGRPSSCPPNLHPLAHTPEPQTGARRLRRVAGAGSCRATSCFPCKLWPVILSAGPSSTRCLLHMGELLCPGEQRGPRIPRRRRGCVSQQGHPCSSTSSFYSEHLLGTGTSPIEAVMHPKQQEPSTRAFRRSATPRGNAREEGPQAA